MSGFEPIDPAELPPGMLDPLAQPFTNFDYDAVERALSGENPEPDTRSDFVIQVFQWVIGPDVIGRAAIPEIGRRFVALARVVSPGLFDGGPSSLGINDLGELTADASRAFGKELSHER